MHPSQSLAKQKLVDLLFESGMTLRMAPSFKTTTTCGSSLSNAVCATLAVVASNPEKYLPMSPFRWFSMPNSHPVETPYC